MIEDDAVAVDAQIVRVDDDAPLGGGDRNAGRDGEVEPEMDLLVDLLPVVNVGAAVSKLRLNG